MGHVRATIFSRPKDISNELLWVFVAQIIRHAKGMYRILLSSINCQTLRHIFFHNILYIFTFDMNGKNLWKELLSIKCVYRFTVLRSAEMFLILRNKRRNKFINMHSSIQKSQFLCNNLQKVKFLQKF